MKKCVLPSLRPHPVCPSLQPQQASHPLFRPLLTALLAVCLCGCSQDTCSDFPETPANLPAGPARIQGDGAYESLGCGYDVTGEYLDFYSIRKPVVDVDAFVHANSSKLYTPFIGNIKTVIYGGENYLSYLHEIQEESEFNRSLTIPGASSSESSIFSSGAKQSSTSRYEYSTKYSYARADVIKRQRQYELDALPDQLADYLTADFTSDLANLSPENLIAKYGTHVLLDIEVGGIYCAKYKSQITEEKSTEIRTKTVKAGITNVLKVIGIQIDSSLTTTEQTELEKKNTAWRFEIESNGGTRNGVSLSFSSDSSMPGASINIDSWAASVDDTHSVLVHINWENAYPLYLFIQDPVRRQELQAAVAAHIRNARIELLELIPLYRLCRTGDFVNTFNILGDERLYYYQHEAPHRKQIKNEGLIGYVLKEAVDMHCEPLYSIDNSRTKNTFTVLGDEELNYFLHVKPNYADRHYDAQLGYAYTLQVPHTEPMYRVDNSKYKDTFTVVGDDQLNYYLHEREGYANRSYDGQTGYIYPASFE